MSMIWPAIQQRKPPIPQPKTQQLQPFLLPSTMVVMDVSTQQKTPPSPSLAPPPAQ
ncbi:hypothetical protein [Synechococcus sp. KORDI-100]|uniref:hypothetical protein n=1 Tax=Synechococcus sp. KORDI-100 TaxID=1280380 RepID=UPI000AB7400B|nr:hypothetical protein [Synechococcus sp. KORDI-100]